MILIENVGPSRGEPRPAVKTYLACHFDQGSASLVSAAEVWYWPEIAADGKVVVKMRWPCGCGAEHVGELVRW